MTPAQFRVLAAVRRVTADGWPATVREVMIEAGLASTSTVHVHLQALENAGLIETNPRSPTRRSGWRATQQPTAGLS